MGGSQILFGNCVRKGGGGAALFCSLPSPFWFFFNLIYSNSWLIWAKVLQGQKKQGKSVKSDIKWRIRPIVVR